MKYRDNVGAFLLFGWVTMVCVFVWMDTSYKPIYAQDVKFVLSEVENLKLENLRLKRDLTQCQLNQVNSSYSQELNTFVSSTLKAHGTPANVVFDQQNMTFRVTEQKEDKKTEKSDTGGK